MRRTVGCPEPDGWEKVRERLDKGADDPPAEGRKPFDIPNVRPMAGLGTKSRSSIASPAPLTQVQPAARGGAVRLHSTHLMGSLEFRIDAEAKQYIGGLLESLREDLATQGDLLDIGIVQDAQPQVSPPNAPRRRESV
ncbi:MAG: hypothetical protein KIT83_17680 [Bryobacterales bacterium]|nr:hypothetical protein [Bryobacterales bacterium]